MTTAQDYGLRKKVFAITWVVIFMAAGTSAYSVFKASVMEATGGTDSQISIAYTMQQLFVTTLGIFSGRTVNKIGPRIAVYLGGPLYGFGWLVGGLITSMPMFYLFFGVVNGIGSGPIYNSSVATGLRWYPEGRGTMSGLLPMFASMEPFLTSRFGEILCNGLGLGAKGLLVIRAAYTALVWTVGWIMTVPSKDWVTPPIPTSVTNTKEADQKYGPFDMSKTLRFQMMTALMYLASMMGIMFAGAFSGVAQAQLGVRTAAAPWIVGISALANFMGRTGFGRVYSRLGEAKTILIILVVTISSLSVMRNVFTVPMLIIRLIFIGAASDGALTYFPPFIQKVFGTENSGANYRIIFLGYASGSCFGLRIATKTKMLEPDGVVMATFYANVYSTVIAVGVTGVAICFLLMYVKDRYVRQVKAI